LILWTVIGIILQYELYLLFAGLLIISALYSSVGHGGASGYLAILSLSSYGLMSHIWLKQHVWIMNLVVAAIAFYHYNKAGFHLPRLTIPFIIASIPTAFLGGYVSIDPELYDILLSITLLWAAYKVVNYTEISNAKLNTPRKYEPYLWGGGIGFFSGLIGVGGGIFLSPIILLKRWATVKSAAATAAVFIFVNSLAGLVGMGMSNQLNLDVGLLANFVIAITIGGFIGSLYGAKHADNKRVRDLLAVVLVIAAAKRFLELL
tara:strand:+ start:1483 stop:2268 length:786 start_codon:yes stop_codon:yes gene_type:complete